MQVGAELEAVGASPLGSLSGFAYVDVGGDAVKGPNDPGIAGVTVILEGVDQYGKTVRRTQTTGADGGYRFDQLQAGAYSLTEVQPSGHLDALDGAGSEGGVVGDDKIQSISLRAGARGVDYNFGEHRAPAFTTGPVLEVKSGAAYAYAARASDPENDPIGYTLVQGPAGLAVNGATGVVAWSPSAGDVGSHAVVLRASDGRGGTAFQTYTLTVLNGHPNRPPAFTSTPVVDARVGIPYVYQAQAVDPDGDSPLIYDLVAGPAGLSVSPSGLVSWTPTDAQLGPHTVAVRVTDGRTALPNDGGTDRQTYTILVQQSPENHPPVIVSQPKTVYRPPTAGSTATLYAKIRDLRGGRPDVQPGGLSGVVTGMVASTLGSDGTPVYASPNGAYGIVPNAEWFYDWYHDVPNTNLSTIIPLTFAETSPGSGTYAYSNYNFFPIDGQLFGNEPLFPSHNFYFTAEIHTTFTYRASGSQTFQVTSDDDSWVFINKQLAVDVGGVHSVETRSVNLSTLGLVDGATYPLDVFFAERMTGGSILALQSNFPLEPPRYVYDVDAVDPDNDPITYSLVSVSPPAPSMTIDPVTGILAWAPTAAQADSYAIVVQAADGRGGFDQQSFTLVVSGAVPNAAPVIQSTPTNRLILGDTYTYKVSATDSDGDPVRYTLLGGPSGMLLNTHTGELTWPTTSSTSVGLKSVSISATDGRGGISAPQNFTILVTRFSNGDPTITSSPSLTGVVGQKYTYQAVATDPENDRLEFDLPVRPAGMAISPATGLLAWTPANDQVGPFDVVVRVRDVLGGVYLQAFRITVGDGTNHPPMIVSSPPYPALQGRPYKYQIAALDPDPVDATFTYSFATTQPSGMSMNAAGLIQWTPSAVGNYRIAVKATDPRGASTIQSFVLRVDAAPGNRNPMITSTPRMAVRKGDLYLYAIQATDPDLDALTYSVTLPAGATGLVYDSVNKLIKWPSAGAIGTYGPIVITVSDGRGGTSTPQSYNLQVAAQDANQEPVITSTAPPLATYGAMYSYDAAAVDPDGDPVAWNLVAGPDGMVVDPTRGSVRWTPRADQIGPQTVVVRARDPKGGFSTQSFSVLAQGANLPPQITSPPLTRVKSQAAYSSLVAAVDPDDKPEDLIYTLVQKPSWIAGIDYKTHVISGTAPTVATSTSYTVQIQVDDGKGGIGLQTYSVVVEPALKRPPSITSTPQPAAIAGTNYQYQVIATDPDGGTLTYSKAGSTPAWLTINATSGLLQGTPPTGGPPSGTSYSVTVKATTTDPSGAWAEQTYTLFARTNAAPTITSTYVGTVTAGMIYRYDVVGADPNGDPLTYQFVGTPPAGMTIDPATGRITWLAPLDKVGQSVPVAVRAVDPYGAVSATQSYNLAVAGDTTKPGVSVGISSSPAPINSQVRFLVTASDDVGVASIALTVAGQSVALDGHGAATATMGGSVGPVAVVVTVKDAAGNTTTFQPEFVLYDPTDTSAPTVSLNAVRTKTKPGEPAAVDDVVTAPTDVTGSVADPQLTSWILDVAPLHGGAWTVIGRGAAAVTNGKLGALDTSRFANGSYTLRLTAYDSGGHTSSTQRVVTIDSTIKVGSLKLSFTDLTLPVAGIPITISRSYDSLRALEDGEVGFGWRLDFGDMKVEVSTPDSSLGAFSDQVPFRFGTRVIVTGPDGVPQGFTFGVQPSSGFFGIVTGYKGYFTPDPGVTSTLTAPAVELTQVGSEYISLDAGGIPYNPADPAFGGTYTLRTQSGISHTIDAATGRLLSLSDRNQNTLKIRDDGIFSDSGRAVTFERDARGRITKITDPRNHSVVYTYNAAGDLASVRGRDAAVNPVQFVYDPSRPHFLQQVIDPLGRISAQAAYNAEGRVSTITDAAGKAVANAYDVNVAASTITQTVTDQNNKSSTITYDVLNNKTKFVDAANKTSKYVYDQNKRLVSQTQVVGLDDDASVQTDDLLTTYEYDGAGNIKTVIDAMGRKTRVTYDAYGQPVTITSPTGETTTSSYDPVTGNLLSQTDAAGNKSSFSYDPHGNVKEMVSGLDGSHWFYGDPAGRPNTTRTQFQYNQYGELVQTTDARGRVTILGYDDNGNATGSQYTWVDPENPLIQRTVTVTNVYDDEDRLTSTIGPSGTTVTEYDALGRPWRTTDEYGGKTTTTYDVRGLAIQVQTPDARISRTVYDDKGRAIWTDDPHLSNQATAGTHVIYDDLDRVVGTERYSTLVVNLTTTAGVSSTSVVAPNVADLTSTSSTTYDDAGRVKQSVVAGHAVNYEYDGAGRQTAVIDVVGGVTRRTETDYDASGRAVKSRDALGHETVTVYDANGRPVETIFADSTSVTTTYDQLGRRIASTDQLGQTTNYEYDRFGALTAVVLPKAMHYEYAGASLTQVTARARYEYTYDAYGNMSQIQDPLGRLTKFAYDEQNRKVKHTLPLAQSETWRYDSKGRVDRHVDFNGKVEKFAYDALGRLYTDSFHDTEAGAATATITYTYDAYAGTDGVRKDTVVDSRYGTADRYFDREGRMIKIVTPEGTIRYEYDALGRMKREYTADTAALAKTDVSYQYDEVGRLWKVDVAKLNGTAAPLTTQYTYNLMDQPISTALPNGTTETRTYDGLNRLASVVTKRNSDNATLASFVYTLDLTGRRVAVDESGGRRVEYAYDAPGRLVRERVLVSGTQTQTIDHYYDRVGNQTQSYAVNSGTPTDTRLKYDANDRLIEENGYARTYDAAGSLSTQAGPAGSAVTNTWDAAGRLTRSVVGSTTYDYRYNADGIRISQAVGGATTKYLIDETEAYDQVIEEYAPGGALAATYVRGLDLLFQDRGGAGARSFVVKDGLGSVRALTNTATPVAVTDTFTYDAYGNETARTGPTVLPYRFAGEAYDAGTKNYYLRARYYNPAAARFTSSDTYDGRVNDPLTLNHYIYAGSNPVSYIDPSGRNFTIPGLNVSMAIGTAIPAGLGAASSVVYAKYLGGNPLKGFLVGAELGIAIDYAYFSGGGGVKGLKKVAGMIGDSLFVGVVKLAAKHAESRLLHIDYPGVDQTRDFIEAFSAAAVYHSIGNIFDNSSIGDDPLDRAKASFLASFAVNFANELTSYFRGDKGFGQTFLDAAMKTQLTFIQGTLLSEAFSDIRNKYGKEAIKTVLGTSYQLGINAVVKILGG